MIETNHICEATVLRPLESEAQCLKELNITINLNYPL